MTKALFGGDYILAAHCAIVPLNERLFAHLNAGDVMHVFTPDLNDSSAWWALFPGDALIGPFYCLIGVADLVDTEQWIRDPKGKIWQTVTNVPDAPLCGEFRCQTMRH